MSDKKDLYRFEEERSLEEIAGFFKNIAGNLENGHISFEDGTEIQLPDDVVLDIDVDRRDKEDVVATSVEIELKWAE